MTVKEKSQNGTVPVFVVEFVPRITQLMLEEWTESFIERGGPEATGKAKISSITVRALNDAGILVKPKWTDEDIDNALPWQVTKVANDFDLIYEEITAIPGN